MISNACSHLFFGRYQPPKLAEEWCCRIFKNEIKNIRMTYEIKIPKKIRSCDVNYITASWNIQLYLYVYVGRVAQLVQ